MDRDAPQFFLTSGTAILKHSLRNAWRRFVQPAGYKGVIFFLDDLQNPASSNADAVALSLRDQFQSFAIDGINCSLCFSAPLNYFSNIATVRFRDRSTSEISRCDACYVKQFALPLPWD
ncbi:MAG: hypothetical protein DMG70_04500 [Acidobacteria bacterium]|nr:MAG: hypothetical protein DMG70_04500 [Acidobacteriota bacterium]